MSIKIATWNVCLGIFQKTSITQYFHNKFDLDILIITEAEIKPHHDFEILNIPNYQLMTPNMRSNTRIMAYVKTKLKPTLNRTNDNLETISLTINHIKILGVYRQFKLTHHRNSTDQIVDLCREVEDHDVIIGDLNLDYNKKNIATYRFTNIYEKWLETVTSKELVQVNDKNTWFRKVNDSILESCLDHIYLKFGKFNFEVFQEETTSDHALIGVLLGNQKKQRSTLH